MSTTLVRIDLMWRLASEPLRQLSKQRTEDYNVIIELEAHVIFIPSASVGIIRGLKGNEPSFLLSFSTMTQERCPYWEKKTRPETKKKKQLSIKMTELHVICVAAGPFVLKYSLPWRMLMCRLPSMTVQPFRL